MAFCDECGAKLDDGAAFCDTCGAACGAQTTAPAKPAAPAPKPAFVFVEGGSFQMGDMHGEGREQPVHTVTVSSFHIGAYPVTQKEYAAVMGDNPSYFKGDSLPVEQVTWFDAVEYCNKRSLKEGLTPAYTVSGSGDDREVRWNREAGGYRLPTEAEWEYAARGGRSGGAGFQYSGGDDPDAVAWHDDNSRKQTHPVGQKQPNSLGLFDMSGNVFEWCWDWCGEYPSAPQTDPEGERSTDFRAMRGGSYYTTTTNIRSAYRGGDSPSIEDRTLGFRLVR